MCDGMKNFHGPLKTGGNLQQYSGNTTESLKTKEDGHHKRPCPRPFGEEAQKVEAS